MTRQKNIRAAYRDSDTGGFSASVLIPALKALCTTLVASCLLLVAAASIACSLSDPVSAVDAAAWVCLGAASLVGGIASAVISRQNTTVVALISGGMFVCLLLILAFGFDSIGSPLYMMLGYALSLCLHLLGAHLAKKLLGGKKRKRRTAY